MKLSEMKPFTVITVTEERNRAIQEAVFKKGGGWPHEKQKIEVLHAFCLTCNGGNLGWDDEGGFFCDDQPHFPTIPFPEVMGLISQLDDPQPEPEPAGKLCRVLVCSHCGELVIQPLDDNGKPEWEHVCKEGNK